MKTRGGTGKKSDMSSVRSETQCRTVRSCSAGSASSGQSLEGCENSNFTLPFRVMRGSGVSVLDAGGKRVWLSRVPLTQLVGKLEHIYEESENEIAKWHKEKLKMDRVRKAEKNSKEGERKSKRDKELKKKKKSQAGAAKAKEKEEKNRREREKELIRTGSDIFTDSRRT